jgi:muramoyltetrapeptide carboxypeptidase
MLAHSIGTPFEVATAGRILFVEEVNEPFYKVDRLVRQLLLAGKLHRVRGVLIGSFRGCGRGAAGRAGALFLEALGSRRVPVAGGFPAGHGMGNRPFPLGTPARLDAAAGTVLFPPSLAPHGSS